MKRKVLNSKALQSMPSARELAQDRRMAVQRAINRLKSESSSAPVFTREQTWRIPKPPPGVIPESSRMAMDEAMDSYGAWAMQNALFAEGQAFLGYPYLSELAQRPEYRIISETWAQEMTRKWIRLVSTGDTPIEEKQNKLKEIEAELKRLKVQDCFKKCVELDGFFGRAQIYIDLGVDSQDRDELKTPIGDGAATSRLSRAKVKKNSLKHLRVIEPVWTYPNSYNANDPLKADFFMPSTWFVMGQEIHTTRILTFIGRPVPDLLKPAYSFGGLSLSQMAKPYVDNWLRTRQSVSDAISNFSIMVLMTDMAAMLDEGANTDLLQRAEFFNVTRDNRGLMVADKNNEDLKNVSMPISGLDHLQAQSQEHMCLSKGTLIETDRGQIPVEEVTVFDKVMTRNGYAPVAWSGISKYASHFVEIETENSILQTTEEHPIWSEKTNGFVNAKSVDHTHSLRKSLAWESTESLLRGEADCGVKPKQAITGIQKLVDCCIELFTKHTSEKFQQVLTFITRMKTLATIQSQTLSYCHAQITQHNMNHVDLQETLIKNSERSVLNVERHTAQHGQAEHDFVPTHVKANHGSEIIQIIDIRKISTEIEEPVYDVGVAEGYLPEFYANGILVHNSAVSQIPLVKLTGVSPSGLNATSEYEVSVFYEKVEAQQVAYLNENLSKMINFVQLSLYGEIDPEIGFVWEPLEAMDPAELATQRKTEADTDIDYINAGVISPQEARTRLADDQESPYAALDLSEEALPEPPAQPGQETDEHGNSIGAESPDAAEGQAPTQGAVKQGNTASEKSNKPVESKPIPGGKTTAHDIAMDFNPNHSPEDGEFAKGTGEASGRKNVVTSKELPVDSEGNVTLTHYSQTPGITALNPYMYGSGLRGAEAKRMQADPQNWVARSYHYIGPQRKEAGLGNNKYTSKVPVAKLYDFANDPDNLFKKTGEGSNALNVYEKAIKKAGYTGYYVDNPHFSGLVAATFNSLPVIQQAQDAEWNESEHPRGQPENAGEFAKSAGTSKIHEGAKKLAAMPKAQVEDLTWEDIHKHIPEHGNAAYNLYEAQKLVPKPADKLKRVTDDNSWSLYQDQEFVANINGVHFGITKQEDPDDPDDEDKFVYAYQRLDDPTSKLNVTTTDDKAELIKELKTSSEQTQKPAIAKYPEPHKTLPDNSPLLVDSRSDHTPEAQAERVAIGKAAFEKAKPVTGRKPVFYVMGGGSGAGKGVLLRKLQEQGVVPTRDNGAVIIDPDDIKTNMNRYKQIFAAGDYRASATVHEDASTLSKEILNAAREGHYDIVFDVTMSDHDKGVARIKQFKDAGYTVKMYNVVVDPDIALERAMGRYKSTGRYVSPEVLHLAHENFNKALPDYEKLVDEFRTYSNNDEFHLERSSDSKQAGDDWNEALHPRGQPENAGEFARSASGIKQYQKRPLTAATGHKVMFEVAPDPDNKELSAKWNKLSPEIRTQVSSAVLKDVLPEVLEKTRANAKLHMQYGGYLKDTNPSVSLVLGTGTSEEQADLLTRSLGAILDQQSMMRVSKKPFAGSTEMGAVVIRVPKNISFKNVETMYTTLRQSVLDDMGNPLINGHTTDAGRMIILVDKGTEEEIHHRVDKALKDQYEVGFDTLNVSWPEKGEDNYGFNRQGKSGRGLPNPSIREWVNSLRSSTTNLLNKKLRQYETDHREG